MPDTLPQVMIEQHGEVPPQCPSALQPVSVGPITVAKDTLVFTLLGYTYIYLVTFFVSLPCFIKTEGNDFSRDLYCMHKECQFQFGSVSGLYCRYR